MNLTKSSKKILNPTKAYLVGWEPPVDGCIKLNVDGSVIQPVGSETCGGLFRNGDGNLVAGFMMKIGRVTITSAEIWAIYTGMKLAVELGINKLQIETDFFCALKLIDGSSSSHHHMFSLIKAIEDLRSKMTYVSIKHIFCEANFCADVLAKQAQSLPTGLLCFAAPPPFLMPILADDRGRRKSVRVFPA
ncbi:hypothetical protein Ahy_A08g039435 [Arachis hypogaea]|uniref:RNase H type-1 domain-containing protein n=1 Tax=Arachis hypogaea TaxID=3818 RepID=A0A445BWS8_ARAHY|nr:hypothetical protein Ahy_A08g039435 [Arachis hypogaea]